MKLKFATGKRRFWKRGFEMYCNQMGRQWKRCNPDWKQLVLAAGSQVKLISDCRVTSLSKNMCQDPEHEKQHSMKCDGSF